MGSCVHPEVTVDLQSPALASPNNWESLPKQTWTWKFWEFRCKAVKIFSENVNLFQLYYYYVSHFIFSGLHLPWRLTSTQCCSSGSSSPVLEPCDASDASSSEHSLLEAALRLRLWPASLLFFNQSFQKLSSEEMTFLEASGGDVRKIRQPDRDFLSNPGQILTVMSLMMSSGDTQTHRRKSHFFKIKQSSWPHF